MRQWSRAVAVMALIATLVAARAQQPTPVEPPVNEPSAETPAGKKLRLVSREVKVVTMDYRRYAENVAMSRDCKHIAFDQLLNGRVSVVADGVEGPLFISIKQGSLGYSPDGQHLGYIAKQAGSEFVVIDNEEGPHFKSIGFLVFSPDSKRRAYTAAQDEFVFAKWRMVLDGKEGKEYVAIEGGALRFSPDSKRIAFVARTESKKNVVVVDDQEGKEYDLVTFPVYSRDSKRIAYLAQRNGKWLTVVDGVEGPAYDKIAPNNLTFSPDSQRLLYIATRGKEMFLVIDGQEQKVYPEIQEGSALFSPDSKRIAYIIRRAGRPPMPSKMAAVIDGREGREYIGVSDVLFSGNSQHVLYVVVAGKQEQRIILDGQESAPCSRVSFGQYPFSPDGEHSAIVVTRLGQQELLLDGRLAATFDAIQPGGLLFSPDSRHLAVVVFANGAWQVLLDGKPAGPPVEVVAPDSLMFSPDSRHLAYWSRIGPAALLFVDGVATQPCESFSFARRPVFDGPNLIRTLAVRQQRNKDGEVSRIETELIEE